MTFRIKLSKEERIKALEELLSFLLDCVSDSNEFSPSEQLQLHKLIGSVGFALMELRENETSRSK